MHTHGCAAILPSAGRGLHAGCWACPVGSGSIPWVLAPSHRFWPYFMGAGLVPWVLAPSHGCWTHLMGPGPIPQLLAPSHSCWPHPTGAGLILQVLSPCCGCWPRPMGADPVSQVLASSHGYWLHPKGVGLIPWVPAPSCKCRHHPVGSCPVQWVLAPPHGCWPHLPGAGPTLQVLALSRGCWPHQGCWGSYQGTGSRVLGVLEEGEDPPLQHRPGRAPVLPGEQQGGHAGGQHSSCPLCPPGAPFSGGGDTGMCLPEPLPSVHCLSPVEHSGFFEAFKLEGKKGGEGGVRSAPCPPWCWGGEGLLPLPMVLTFSSLSPSWGGTVLCRAESPLSWLELLLARSWRPLTDPWGERAGDA